MRKALVLPALAICLAATAAVAFSQPVATPSPPVSPVPQPSATLSAPVITPTPLPTPPVLPPDAPPQIVGYDVSTNVLFSGETVTGKVITSTNVASVELRIATVSLNMPRTDFGQFAISFQVPSLPFFVPRGPYTMRIIARNTPGVAVEQDIPMTLR